MTGTNKLSVLKSLHPAFLLLIFTFLSGLYVTCKTPERSGTKSHFHDPLFTFYRGSCYGKCPVYTITVFTDHSVQFIGRKFIQPEGSFVAELSDSEYEYLVKLCNNANLWSMDNRYHRDIADLPMTRFIYYESGATKEISGNGPMPNALKKIFDACDDLIDKTDWKPADASSMRDSNSTERSPEIIVQLKNKVDFEVWKLQYKNLGLQAKKKIAPNFNYWLISYDQGKMQGDDLIQELRNDEQVVDAQFNKSLSSRK